MSKKRSGIGEVLRKQLIVQLKAGQAYIPVEKAIREVPIELAGQTMDGVRHTAREILEQPRCRMATLRVASEFAGLAHADSWRSPLTE